MLRTMVNRALRSVVPGRYPHRSMTTTAILANAGAPLEQLRRVQKLQDEVSATNSKSQKEQIIAGYSDLRELLEHVYDPNHRTHLSSAALLKYKPPSAVQSRWPERIPSSITDLFDTLSSRRVPGNAAKDLVQAFLANHGVEDEAVLEVFYRLLDRNLVAGFGARTLMQVQWTPSTKAQSSGEVKSSGDALPPSAGPTSASLAGADPTALESTSARSRLASTPATPPKPSRALKAFSCALGKTVTPPFGPLFKGGAVWYASRKLDGVRCLTFLDFDVSDPSAPQLDQIQHLSRTGKPFHTLGNLEPQLRLIERYPVLRDLLAADPTTVELDDGTGPYKRLVLDGEICVMVPSATAPASAPTVSSETNGADGVSAEAVQLWTETGLVEDFPSTVSEMRRQKHTIERPAYYLFDLLSYAEFEHGGALLHTKGLGKSFAGRVADLRDMAEWLSSELNRAAEGKVMPMMIALPQQQVTEEAEVEEMVETAARNGWEGLVLRADKGYVGKRSTDVRKSKQWQDAEYIVTSLDISRQRLAVDGVFGEYEAVAAVHVQHKGHQVAVGSGLTAEQRISWAKDPTRIIGKQITVEYFSESEAQGRPGVMSLRFPRIKAVWDGKRDV